MNSRPAGHARAGWHSRGITFQRVEEPTHGVEVAVCEHRLTASTLAHVVPLRSRELTEAETRQPLKLVVDRETRGRQLGHIDQPSLVGGYDLRQESATRSADTTTTLRAVPALPVVPVLTSAKTARQVCGTGTVVLHVPRDAARLVVMENRQPGAGLEPAEFIPINERGLERLRDRLTLEVVVERGKLRLTRDENAVKSILGTREILERWERRVGVGDFPGARQSEVTEVVPFLDSAALYAFGVRTPPLARTPPSSHETFARVERFTKSV